MKNDFMLSTKTAQVLYHTIAADLPMIDYHCHLSAKEIYEDRRFQNITKLWLEGDHYKWRLMRSFGVEEKYITGEANDKEKFLKWVEALETAIGNPLYHWSHLELQNYFGFDSIICRENSESIWNLCSKKLAREDFSARNLILRSGVEVICTTDDPADTLAWHKALRESDFAVKVLPSFRPDKALGIEKADFTAYLEKLGHITSFASLKEVLKARLDYFVSLGCKVSDHGLAAVPFAPAEEAKIEAIFQKRLKGILPTAPEEQKFKTALLLFLGREYAARDMVMQLHFGVMRDINTRVYAALGADAGIDAIGDAVSMKDLAAFLNALEKTGELPKTILYSLNGNDNAALMSVIGAFQGGGVKGKVQLGSAWWFQDHESGMRAQLKALAAQGHLATFVGMLTDSRSFLSYARHEYFRRILCDVIGTWVEEGKYPDDERLLNTIIRGICYENAKKYFGF